MHAFVSSHHDSRILIRLNESIDTVLASSELGQTSTTTTGRSYQTNQPTANGR